MVYKASGIRNLPPCIHLSTELNIPNSGSPPEFMTLSRTVLIPKEPTYQVPPSSTKYPPKYQVPPPPQVPSTPSNFGPNHLLIHSLQDQLGFGLAIRVLGKQSHIAMRTKRLCERFKGHKRPFADRQECHERF